MKVSELMSKMVLSLYEAERVGTVKNVIFDSKLRAAKYLHIFCEEDNQPEDKYVAVKDIYKKGKDVLVIKNTAGVLFRLPDSSLLPCPLRAEVYTPFGEKAAVIQDVEVNEKYATDFVILSDKTKPAPDRFLSLSGGAAVLKPEEGDIKVRPPQKKIPKADDRKVKIVREENTYTVVSSPVAVSSPVTPAPEEEKPVEIRPETWQQSSYTHYRAVIDNSSQRIGRIEKLPPENVEVSHSPATQGQNNYAFLLGKTVTADLFSDNGIKIAKAGDVIDEKIIDAAKAANRIVQLALASS